MYIPDCRQTKSGTPIYDKIKIDRSCSICMRKKSDKTKPNTIHHTGRLSA